MTTIKVTAKHIARAKKLFKSDSWYLAETHCPIALAAKQKYHKKVSVGNFELHIFDKNRDAIEKRFPEKVKKFISRFDEFYDHKLVKPFSFELL